MTDWLRQQDELKQLRDELRLVKRIHAITYSLYLDVMQKALALRKELEVARGDSGHSEPLEAARTSSESPAGDAGAAKSNTPVKPQDVVG